jgi:hypothetical protein
LCLWEKTFAAGLHEREGGWAMGMQFEPRRHLLTRHLVTWHSNEVSRKQPRHTKALLELGGSHAFTIQAGELPVLGIRSFTRG